MANSSWVTLNDTRVFAVVLSDIGGNWVHYGALVVHVAPVDEAAVAHAARDGVFWVRSRPHQMVRVEIGVEI